MKHLSRSQKLIYDMEKYSGGAISVICGSMLLRGETSADDLQMAANELRRINSALRTRIVETDAGTMQIVEEYAPQDVKVLRFSSKLELTTYAEAYAQEPLPLYSQLCEFTVVLFPGQSGLLVKLHHIIGDAWTLALLGTQCNAILNGKTPPAYPYDDHLQSEDAYLRSERYGKDRAYFLQQFKKCREVTYLVEKQNSSVSARRKTFIIDKEKTEQLVNYAKSRKASIFALFLTIVAAYFSRVTQNVEKFYIGTAVLNRAGAREKNTAGMFINMIPLLMELENAQSFSYNLEAVKATAFAAFRHQKFNYDDILTAIRREYGSSERLYDVMFSYQNATITGGDSGMESTWYHCGAQTESLQIHIDDRDNEGILCIHFDYQTEKFTEREIERMYDHMLDLLFDAIKHDHKKLTELELLTSEEKQQLLYDFNDTAEDYPSDKCVHTLFEEQAARTPDRKAVVACDRTLTYRELNEQANRIAHGLIAYGVKPGDIVAFMLPRRSYLIATIFGILKAGAAYLPIDPDYPRERIDYMLEDSKATYFITEANIQELLANENATDPMIAMVSDSLCYCIYTSGSTGRPKGTLLRHRGIVNLVTDLNIYYDLSKCKRIGFMTTVTFDVATQEIFTALLNGFTGVLTAERKETKTDKIMDSILDNKIDVIYATPTYLDALTDSAEKAEKLLSAVKVICLAGEKFYLNRHVLSLKDQYPVIFENQYGPAEVHVITTTTIEHCTDITIGKPIANTQIYIVDKYMRPVPIGVIGELCVAGDGVGAGYLNRSDLTAEKFVNNLFGEGKLYKTGDLAYWREDGNIVYVGRNDFQVKIRGLRIELGEIENAILEIEDISQAAVVVRKNEAGRQFICAFYTGREMDGKTLRNAIGKKLPKYMLPHSFTHLVSMPLTSSGKVSRKALPEIDLNNIATTVKYIAPKTEQETALINAAQKVLHSEKIGVADNFFDLGGDSLKAIELISALEQTGYRAEIKTIFETDTLEELAGHLTAAETNQEVEIPDGPIPATDAQVRIYTAQAVAGGTAYNVPYVFQVKQLDPVRLQAAVSGLVARHESLRTRFENRDDQIMQIVEDTANCSVEALDSGDISAFARPFDLETTPLLRVGYYQNTVMIDMHHIITDGGSMPVFLRELNELYMGRELDKKPVQYREFAVKAHDYTRSEQYWLSVYADEPPVLEVNTDHPRQNKQTFSGAAMYETLAGSLHAQICEKCRVIGITPYAFYMGAFYILLSKFSGNEDIVVGVPTSGRSGKFLSSIGMFVNTLALRSKPEGDKTTMAFLREIREMTVQALDHQEYPYGELVKKLDIHTENRNPLFDVMFAYQSEKMTDVVFGGEPAELLPIPVTTSKYDITLNVLPRQEDVVLMAEYCVDLYEERTLHRLMEGYKLILTQMLDSGKQLKDISAVTDTERQQIFYAFNDTAADYPRDKCVHTLFEEQAAKTPNKTAVVACDRTLTYQELNEQANRIAHGLIAHGVKCGDIVAFALPRRSYLIAVIFGILKAGAAYLPIDPDYPQDRIDYMLENSKAAYFITELNICELLANENVTDPIIAMASDSLCYCIYTSGSTGRPKGTLLRHRGIVNLVTNLKMYHDLSNCKRIGFMTTITFDVATQEIFTALLNGFTGVLVAERRETGTDKIISSIKEEKIDVIYATPTYLDALTNTEERAKDVLSSVKVICLAGEKFSLNHHVLHAKEQYPVIFENQYGPVELHVIATSTTLENDDYQSIGKPIWNNRAYIVDRHMNLVPIGVTGELCIAGDGVGAGYLNHPELTAEKFIDNPFGEGKLYKTGDLAYWREDGNIVYVGRNDFQVKIRGLRIELGEIENAIQEVEDISQAAVVVRKNEAGRQFICAFYTGQETDAKTLRAAIGKKLPKYMLPHSFTHLVSMPLTSSGKVSRKALPEVDLKSTAGVVEYAEPKTEREIALCTAVQTVLHIEKVGMAHNFFDLGGDSLKAIELIAVLEQAGYSTEVKTVFEVDTLEELAERLTGAEAEQEAAIPTGPIPATDAQVRVYTSQTMAGGTAYNVPYAFRVEQLDPEKLQTAVSGLVARHESLRTRFENRDGQIMQIVEDSANCVVEALDSEDISAFIRPFDLEAVPLLRIGYYQNTVMVDMHHIITDGGSIPVFLKELNELYMGRELNKRPAQYREFAVRAHDYTRSEQYWLSVYTDEPPVLDMNTDYPRQGRQTFAGAAVYEELPGALHEQICEKCGTLGITPYAFYMGAFYVLLSKFSGNEDIVVGSPASGRSGKFLNSIGMFVNTLALRGKPEGEKTVSTFLHEIREMTVQALDNQEYPYGNLVKKLGIRTENRNPLFDVMFAYQSEKMADVVFGDEPADLMLVPVSSSKYDITFNVLPRQEDIILMAEYCVDLYKESTIRRLLDGYQLILAQMLDSGKRLRDISAITDSEKRRLLCDFNNTAEDYPKDKCVHTLFEEQAARTPNKKAIVACDQILTYRELNGKANRIAHGLIAYGVKPGDIVAFMLPRRSYLIAAMFGVLKAGAAYLPIDPDYPKERIDYMLEDSKAAYLITEANIQELLENENIANPMLQMTSGSFCYCIYTSGSTGKPKGTLITHQNVANYTDNNNNNNVVHAVICEDYQTIASVTTVGFDIFVTESILPLVNGMTVLFANEEQAKIQTALNAFLQQNPADVMQTTPTKMRILIADPGQCEYLVSLKAIILGGEALDTTLVTDLSKLTSAHIFNIYGPTETTVWSTNTEVLCADDITIGRPIANTQIHIMDKYLRLVPIGVTGELCIAGDGVGAGYLNHPELTTEKFIDNPFGEGKLYKTGDLAYWRKDGNIVYVGRNDFQVKIRGLRIELGEIENALQEVEGISQAVVVVQKDETGRQFICAFYTGCETDGKTFRTAIGQKLPKYMLPHIFTRLDKMPLTSSGKVNRKALPGVNLSMVSSAVEYIAPVGEMEKRLASLMEQTLDYSPIGRNDDFFDLGGDSLKAIEFLSKAHTDGIYFSLQNIFDHHTIKTLCECIDCGDRSEVSCDERMDLTRIAPILARNCLAKAEAPQETKVGNILLTGATGFLGIHLLADYLEHDTGIVYCLVRGKKQLDSEMRLAKLLRFYFNEKYTVGGRVRVVCGDLQKDKLGLPEPTYHELQEQVDFVINAAASVKHYGSYRYFYEVNVESTSRLIAFCKSSCAKLIHISTISVSGNSFADDFNGYISETEKHFRENDLYIGQPLNNVYTRSKFEAEKLVLEAMSDGLSANIMRMGNLTNRFSDGCFQINYDSNAAARRMKGILELGLIPDYLAAEDLHVEFTPVDEAAHAIMTLVHHFSTKQTVFHINSTKPVCLDQLIKFFGELGYSLNIVSGEAFTKALRKTAECPETKHIFETFIMDMDSNDRLNYESNIHVESEFTEEYLRRLGFNWSEIETQYLRKYVEYFKKIGYWEA